MEGGLNLYLFDVQNTIAAAERIRHTIRIMRIVHPIAVYEEFVFVPAGFQADFHQPITFGVFLCAEFLCIPAIKASRKADLLCSWRIKLEFG